MSEYSLGLAELGTAVDMSGLNKGIDDAEGKAKGGFSKIGDIISGAFKVGIAGAIVGVVALGVAVKGGIDDARESARLNASTAQTIETMGNAAGRSAQQVSDLASKLSDANGQSLFGDDQIQQASNLLLTFGEIKGETFDLATALTVDLAQALGGEPKAQAMALGKALNSPKDGFSALSRQGLTFTDDQKKVITAMQDAGDMAGAQALMMAELQKQVGGQAAAAAKAAGGWTQFKARMGEAAETAGGALLPVLDLVANVANDVIAPAIETAAQAFSDLVGYFSAVAEDGDYLNDFLSNLPASIQPVAQFIAQMALGLGNLVATFRDTGALSSEFGETLGGLAAQLGLSAPLVDTFEQAIFAVQGIIGQLVAAFSDGGLQGGIQFLIDKLAEISPGFALLKGVVEAALPPIQDIVLSVFGIITGFMQEHGQTMLADVTEVWNGIQGLISAVLPPIQSVVASIFGAIATFLHEHGAEIQAFLGQTWDQVATIVKTAVELIQAIIVPVFTFVAGFIRDHGQEIQAILSAAWSVISTIITTVLSTIQGVIKAALQIIHGDWSGAWETIKQTCATIVEGLVSIITTNLDLVKTLFGGMASDVIATLDALPDQAAQLGANIVAGIIDGVQGAAGQLMSTLTNLASDALQAAKDALGIASPSREFSDVGEMTMLGLIGGMQAMLPSLTGVIQTVADNMRSHVKKMTDEIADQIQETADELQKQVEAIQDAITDAMVGSFDAEASLDRQKAKNIKAVQEYGGDIRDAVQAQLAVAEQMASSITDPEQAAKFFKLRSEQIMELAELQQQLSETEDEGARAQLQQQIDLITQAQEAERSSFSLNQPTTDLGNLAGSLQHFLSNTNLPGILEDPAIRGLSGFLDQLRQANSTPFLGNTTGAGGQVNLGGVSITQLPGENPQALLERLLRMLEQRLGGRL